MMIWATGPISYIYIYISHSCLFALLSSIFFHLESLYVFIYHDYAEFVFGMVLERTASTPGLGLCFLVNLSALVSILLFHGAK